MKNSIPSLPASSRLKAPSVGGPSISGAIKCKPLQMSGGVPSKGAKSVIKSGGVSRKSGNKY